MTSEQNNENKDYLDKVEPYPAGEPSPVKRKKKKRKKRIIILTVIILLILSIPASFFTMRIIGKNQLSLKGAVLTPDEDVDFETDGETVIYKGKTYRINKNMTNILFMGVDRSELSEDELGYGKNGQADAIYLLAVDLDTKKATVIGLPRDAMADIDVYTEGGNLIGSELRQLCLAYAYGDGMKTSCENMSKAVSRFMYGLPVKSYYAMDISSISAINDSVGGVTVTPNETVKYQIPHKATVVTFEKGKETKLEGDNAIYYLRARDTENKEASYLRMERQMDYLKKFSDKVIAKTKSDLTFPVSVYKSVSKDAATDITVSGVTYLVSELFTGGGNLSMDFYKVKGDITVGENGLAEFYADETDLFEHILSIFYTEE